MNIRSKGRSVRCAVSDDIDTRSVFYGSHGEALGWLRGVDAYECGATGADAADGGTFGFARGDLGEDLRDEGSEVGSLSPKKVLKAGLGVPALVFWMSWRTGPTREV